MTSHSDTGVYNHEVPSDVSARGLFYFLKRCSACECDGTHKIPLNHSAQTTPSVHNSPEPFFLFNCSYFLIFIVSATPGQNDVVEYPSLLVLALFGVPLNSTMSA